MAAMTCTVTETCAQTAREPDQHEGKDHGGGLIRSPVIGVLLLVALGYPLRLRSHSVIENLAIKLIHFSTYRRRVYRLYLIYNLVRNARKHSNKIVIKKK